MQKVAHRSRTTSSDSIVVYGGKDIGNWKNAPQGVLQENTAGPVIWSALSSVILGILCNGVFRKV